MSLPVPDSALSINRKMAAALKKILRARPSSPLDPVFSENFNEFLYMFEHFQKEVFSFSGLRPRCLAGCGVCCFHWVEDVFSFEAVRMINKINTDFSGDRGSIQKIIQENITEIERINLLTAQKIADLSAADFDPEEIVFAAFYQLERSCPLLSAEGSCRIYDVRPISCRAYVNLADAGLCAPDKILDSEMATYFLWPEDDCDELLGKLHKLYALPNEPTALRPLISGRLAEPNSG